LEKFSVRRSPSVAGRFGLEFRVYADRLKAELQTFCKAAHSQSICKLYLRPGLLVNWPATADNHNPHPLMVQIDGLTKLYGEFIAVNELSFSLQSGEVLGLVGPNGAGKTTTLRCLSGVIPPSRGTIRVGGRDIVREPIETKRQLAFFTDEPRLFDYLTVWQHLNFVARIYQVADYEKTGRELLEELELTNKRDALPGELSRGMKQKLAIACGLLHSPRVIYFDEPLTGLDPLGIRRMKDSILKRARAGAAIIISSHLLHLVEEICSRLLIVKNGRKIADGTLAEVTQKFSEQPGDANLEEIFFRATSETGASATPPMPPLEPK
jgi:ABC-2 type transport system ATP-binding protein